MERIDKLFSESNILSRSECKKVVRQKRIKVNGQIINTSSFKVNENDEVLFDDKKVQFSKFVYIMLNKPLGVVSSTDDTRDTTVIDILPQSLKREGLFPCGRLDKDTTGLVIITNDGDSAHRRLSPKNHVEKVYEVTLADSFDAANVPILEKGIVLKDGFETKECRLEMIDSTFGRITLTEGKYHEIKRMFGYFNNRVIKLNRISFGNINLDNKLKQGECRLLSEEEIKDFCK